MDERVQLRAYCYLERLQPRYAAYLGSLVFTDLPVEGMASLFIEVAPGIEVYRLVDVATKSSKARLGAQAVEREFGLFEIHSVSQVAVRDAGLAVLAALSLDETDLIPPRIISSQLIKEVDGHHAQLLNRFRRGTNLLQGETLLVIECLPAAYANLLANEADGHARISVVGCPVQKPRPGKRKWRPKRRCLHCRCQHEPSPARRPASGKDTLTVTPSRVWSR
jgi:hypothetical protein